MSSSLVGTLGLRAGFPAVATLASYIDRSAASISDFRSAAWVGYAATPIENDGTTAAAIGHVDVIDRRQLHQALPEVDRVDSVGARQNGRELVTSVPGDQVGCTQRLVKKRAVSRSTQSPAR